jgi:competence protein ComEC
MDVSRKNKLVDTDFSWNRRTLLRIIFREKIHSSWMIAFGCAGLVVGVAFAITDFSRNFAGFFWVFFGLTLMIFTVISRLRFVVIFAILAGIILGINRGISTGNDLTIWQNFIGKNVEITAKVTQDPGVGSGGALNLNLSEILVNGRRVSGTIFASVNAGDQVVSRSDEVVISGKLKAGFGSFTASLSFGKLAKITEKPGSDPAREVRDEFGKKLREIIPSPAADLGMGILAGQKAALPAALTAAFIAASLTHIVVASGYNLTILIRFARRFFAKISRFAALGFSGILVFAFANITGFSPSMTRASLVAALSLIAWYYGRKFHPIVLLLLTAAITVAIDPTYLWGDAGWWMSFTSFAGVLIFAPLVKSYFWGDEKDFRARTKISRKISQIFSRKKKPNTDDDLVEKKHLIRGIFIETLSAQLLSAPIIALMMGQFSPYGMLANLLVLPVVPLAMFMTFVAGISGCILPVFLARIIAWPATQILNYMISVAKWVSEFPGANQKIVFGIWPAIAVFVVILLATIFMKWRTKHNFYDDNPVE